MGLIKAGIGALGGTLADQWKEFFYCDALPNDVLMRRGQKQITGRSFPQKHHCDSYCRNYRPDGICARERVRRQSICCG